ncbi:hypothetical protein TrRE_jg12690 [Triparma retinervis]|uniref:Uncharacterized protein n=1 Tax=Triparma retinervis TaxID=2557542 RepID=A0A9W6ZAI4_9STRA|nr:hypothetical protein TrRE_jg12690 [Triparma retinervis]
MGLATAVGSKLLAKGFIVKGLSKGIVGLTVVGNALLPNFMKKAMMIKDIVLDDAVPHTPLYMDFEVWLLVSLICFALFVTREKRK